MKAIILAAGQAKRLRPITHDTPKCLLRIGNKCLLENQIDILIKNGVNEIFIVAPVAVFKFNLLGAVQFS